MLDYNRNFKSTTEFTLSRARSFLLSYILRKTSSNDGKQTPLFNDTFTTLSRSEFQVHQYTVSRFS